MRSLPRMRLLVILSAALVPGLVACDPGDDETAPTRDNRPALTAAGDDTQPTPVEVQLRLEGGKIVTDPDSIDVRRNTMVRWTSDPADAVWVVAFSDTDAPFPNGKRVFNGGEPGNSASQAMIRGDAPLQAHKYWVFFPDGSGGYVVQDPKLVVIDDGGMGADSTRN